MTNQKYGFIFAGQGAQTVGMGKDLYENSNAAKQIFQEADDILKQNISKICFTGPEEELTQSRNCQPAIYTMSVACLKALQEQLNISPTITGGLSLGEFAALTAAGALNFSDGIQLVAKRGELMQEACRNSNGAMAAILNADPKTVEKICQKNNIDVANYNCPGQIVISGSKELIPKALEELKKAGIRRIIPLTVDGAFHSRLMQPAADKFTEILAKTTFQKPICAIAQNAVGTLVESPEQIRKNLATQVAGSVKWEECVQVMLKNNITTMIEFGPGKVLSGFMRRIDRKFPTFNISSYAEITTIIEANQP